MITFCSLKIDRAVGDICLKSISFEAINRRKKSFKYDDQSVKMLTIRMVYESGLAQNPFDYF